MPTNFYIGESSNTPDGKRDQNLRNVWKTNPYKFVETLRVMETFSDNTDVVRLNHLGIAIFGSMNLLPPNYGGDNWEYNWARLIAQFVYDRLVGDHKIVYVAGRRSAEAFGLKKVPFCTPCRPIGFREFLMNDTSGVTTFVPIPSPSNNSAWWVDQEEITIARHSIMQLNKRISLGV